MKGEWGHIWNDLCDAIYDWPHSVWKIKTWKTKWTGHNQWNCFK